MKPLAIVTPWFGEKEVGGAETLAYELANRLSRKLPVVVLTTCSSESLKAYEWYVNKYKSGTQKRSSYTIKRFKVDKKNYPKFEKIIFEKLLPIPISKLISGTSPLKNAEEETFLRNNINSKSLERHIRLFYWKYSAFLFLPYLYGTTITIIKKLYPILKNKIILQPCLHNEAYAYLKIISEIFSLSDRILYNSAGEQILSNRLFGFPVYQKGVVVGSGINWDYSKIREDYSPVNKQISTLESKSFIFYLGKKSIEKNTDLLVRSFLNFKKRYPSELKLLLAGTGDGYGNEEYGIIDLGRISEDDKMFLYKNMKAFVNPSVNESFSRVVMEAWLNKKVVLVHKDCLATSTLVMQNKSGFIAETIEEWTDLFKMIDEVSSETLLEYGERGYHYAKENTDWEQVVNRYINIINDLNPKPTVSGKRYKTRIVQLTIGYKEGDAITEHARSIKKFLMGYGIKILNRSYYIDDNIERLDEIKKFHPKEIKKEDAIIFHYSIHSKLIPFVQNHKGKKVMIYHNITPAIFYKKFDERLVELCEKGREELCSFRNVFDYVFCDSKFNAEELKNLGFSNIEVLPIVFPEDIWNRNGDESTILKYADGKKNIVFVGRIAPNKKQEDLLFLLRYILEFDKDVRLILVGYYEKSDLYYLYLKKLIKQLNLEKNVVFTASISQKELISIYRVADLYCSMSEHEGFGVPLIEAMWHDVPVLAYKSTAVSETLGNSGILFDSKSDMKRLAALCLVILEELEVKQKVLGSQRKRREFFLIKNQQKQYERFLKIIED